jgi:hypothetical protein
MNHHISSIQFNVTIIRCGTSDLQARCCVVGWQGVASASAGLSALSSSSTSMLWSMFCHGDVVRGEKAVMRHIFPSSCEMPDLHQVVIVIDVGLHWLCL